MPKHEGLIVPMKDSILLATGVPGAMITNDGDVTWYLVPTASAAKPDAAQAGRIPFPPAATMFPDQLFANIWPGMTVTHVWAYSDRRGGHAQVSHA